MVVVLLVPVALLLPLAAVPVLVARLVAKVLADAEVGPSEPPPPAAETSPVLAWAEFDPVWPVPLALPLLALPVPWFVTVVVFVTLTLAALLAPWPMAPPVAIGPELLLLTLVVAFAPVALEEPLLPLPELLAVLLAPVVLLADVPALPEPEAPEAAAVDVEGEPAEAPVLPVWPVPEPLPLPAEAEPVVPAEVVFDDWRDTAETPFEPLLAPPLGPPAIDPPVAVPAACVNPLVPAKSIARHTELVPIARLLRNIRFL